MNRKKLSTDGLIELSGSSFSKTPDHQEDKIKDSLMTVFAAFSLKYDCWIQLSRSTLDSSS